MMQFVSAHICLDVSFHFVSLVLRSSWFVMPRKSFVVFAKFMDAPSNKFTDEGYFYPIPLHKCTFLPNQEIISSG